MNTTESNIRKQADESMAGKTGLQFVVDMPQMALGGLSESWLSRELGNYHWKLMCTDLGETSNNLINADGQRLYGTFTRVAYSLKTQGNAPAGLTDISECSNGYFDGGLSRYGKSLCFSNINGVIDDLNMSCTAMTTFSSRESKFSNKMVKSSPVRPFSENVILHDAIPKFAKTYLDVRETLTKKSDAKSVQFNALSTDITMQLDSCIHVTSHKINPFTDFNGANLLYFSSYHSINDMCEREYINVVDNIDSSRKLSTTARDIMYFANCDRNDAIAYRLYADEKLEDGGRLLVSTLTNTTTHKLMALICTRKEAV